MHYADNDLVLLQRFTEKGDQAAFSEIVRRYAGMVFSVGRRILGDPARAQDVSQETFFRLMTRPDSVTQSLGGWLHRAATRLAVDERRSDMSRRRRESEVAREAVEQDAALPEPRWSDISPHIDEALAALHERSRALLIRHFLQGCQQQELAREAGVSPATISRRIKLAADELRRELRRRNVDVMPSALIALWATQAIEHVPQPLLHELGKMAMVSGPRVVVHKSAHAMSRHAVTVANASSQARWAAAALFLSALVFALIEAQIHWKWLDRFLPGHNSGESAPAHVIPAEIEARSASPTSGPAQVADTFEHHLYSD